MPKATVVSVENLDKDHAAVTIRRGTKEFTLNIYPGESDVRIEMIADETGDSVNEAEFDYEQE